MVVVAEPEFPQAVVSPMVEVGALVVAEMVAAAAVVVLLRATAETKGCRKLAPCFAPALLPLLTAPSPPAPRSAPSAPPPPSPQ